MEFDDSTVRLVQFKGGSVTVAAERLPEHIITNGTIASPILLAKFLKDLCKQHGFRGGNVALILPENSTIFRDVTMPAISEAELTLNLPYEFRDFLGAEATNYIYDYAVREIVDDEDGNPATMNLLAAAASREIVEAYTLMLKRFHKKLKLAIPREMALVNLLRSSVREEPEMAHREYCIIDIQANSTTVFIIFGDAIRVTKVIDIGCTQIDETIAAALNIDTYLAATYRETNHDDVQALSECQNLYSRISLEVMKTINFYRYENNATEVHEVYFTGEGENIELLKQTIVEDIGFDRCNVADILPASCEKNDLSARCALTIGAVL